MDVLSSELRVRGADRSPGPRGPRGSRPGSDRRGRWRDCRPASLTSGTPSWASCRPVATSHLLIRPSDPPETRVWPSGVKASDSTLPECAVRTSRSARACATSQSLTVRSSLPDASIRPPSRNARPQHLVRVALQRRPGLAALDLPQPDRVRAARREIPAVGGEGDASRLAAFLWPLSSISRGSCGLVRSHSRAPDQVPAARYRPSGEKATSGACSEIGKRVHFTAGFQVPELHRPIPARRGDPAAPGIERPRQCGNPCAPRRSGPRPVSRSHRLIVVSLSPQSSFLPSGEKARAPMVTLAPRPLGLSAPACPSPRPRG